MVLECVVEGIPFPHVTWTKDGILLSTSSDLHNIFFSPTEVASLRINDTSEDDGGVYYCIATNLAGSTQQAFTVEVSRGKHDSQVE